MRYDVNDFQLIAAPHLFRDLRERQFCRIKHDGTDIWPQTAEQCAQVINLAVDKDQLAGVVVLLRHGRLLIGRNCVIYGMFGRGIFRSNALRRAVGAHARRSAIGVADLALVE